MNKQSQNFEVVIVTDKDNIKHEEKNREMSKTESKILEALRKLKEEITQRFDNMTTEMIKYMRKWMYNK